MADKINLAKQNKALYEPSPKTPVLVEVPAFQFLMLDGHGDPNDNPAYQEAVECLYQYSYTLKFGIKKSLGIDYAVMPLEGLWWAEDYHAFSAQAKDDWSWTMMIAQPEWVSAQRVEQACEELITKKGSLAAKRVRLETYTEGAAVQIMHIGPYSSEGPTVERLHAFAAELGYRLEGKHHEIYLGDPRRTAPEKLRTVLRQPVRK